MIENKEKDIIYNEVIDWIKKNEAHFKSNDKELYDKENLERVKRFANAPIDYIDERIELNKEVLINYHKLHTSILIAGLTGFYAILLSKSILSLVNTTEITIITYTHVALLLLLLIGAIIAAKIHITYLILKAVGLLKVIRDSEIEVYYLSKIKEYRNSVKCLKCGKRIPKDSILCYHCGYEMQ